MARVKSKPAVKTPLQPGGGESISEKQRRCARTRQDKMTGGAQVLHELQKKMKKQYQRPLLFRIGTSTNLVILFAPFTRLVREITQFHTRKVTRWTPEAILSLQYVSECILEQMSEVENLLTIHLEHVTVKQEEQEQPSGASATKEGPPNVAPRIVTEPASTAIPPSARDRGSTKVKEEPSWSKEEEDCISKAWNLLMEAHADRHNVKEEEQPSRATKEGPPHTCLSTVTEPACSPPW